MTPTAAAMADVGRRALRWLLRIWFVATAVPLLALGVLRWADISAQVVTTGSMAPHLPVGTLALLSPVDPAFVAVGDVISFRRPEDRSQVVLHRVTEVIDRPDGRTFRTKGDANHLADTHPVPEGDVLGRLRGSLPGVGAAVRWLAPPRGVVILAGVPLLALLVAPAGAPRTRRSGDPTGDADHADLPLMPHRSPGRRSVALGVRPVLVLAAAAYAGGQVRALQTGRRSRAAAATGVIGRPLTRVRWRRTLGKGDTR